ncbi:phosphatidate cytidylyltransferase [Candidatus Dependentiae bacterium]|nr:phosphatidate cytidylyltransferase [Candidatus Dependentiae bacterium]
MVKRIIVAAVLIPIVLFLINLGGWWYRGMITFLLAAGSFEFIYSHRLGVGIINKVLTITALIIFVNLDYNSDYMWNINLFAGLVLIIITSNYLFLPPSEFYDKTKLLFFTLIYLGVFGLHFNLLARIDQSYNYFNKLIIFVLSFSWVCDSGAYFVGSFMGKRQLAPVLSPKKTIEGAIGGTLTSIIYAMLFKKIYFENIGYGDIIFLAVLLSIICPLGDLCASAIKRATNIKNYSEILPGHGGIIDRLDSLLYTATFTVLYYNIKERVIDFI